MDSRRNTYLPSSPHNGLRAWYAFGFWLNLVLIAAGVISTGAALVLERAAPTAPGVGLLIGGGALAVLAWRRAGLALRRVEGVDRAMEIAGSTYNPRVGHHAANAA